MKHLPLNEGVYTANGCKDRDDYLNSLADDRGIDRMAVNIISDMLGENEDFDGLITALDDFKDYEGGNDDSL
jgi:hypothetical protein